jgi:hypothetical protein
MLNVTPTPFANVLVKPHGYRQWWRVNVDQIRSVAMCTYAADTKLESLTIS